MSKLLARRSTVVFVLALAALLAGFITGRDLLFTLAYLLLLLLILSALWSWINLNGVHLSLAGRAQAKELAEHFRREEIAAVLSSPRERAMSSNQASV